MVGSSVGIGAASAVAGRSIYRHVEGIAMGTLIAVLGAAIVVGVFLVALVRDTRDEGVDGRE